jgi:hypothetical protein
MTKVINVEILESKEYAKADKLVGGLTVKSIVEKSPEELREFISATAAFIQKEKEMMKNDPAYKAASDVLKEKRAQLKEAIKEQVALLDLAILVYGKQM